MAEGRRRQGSLLGLGTQRQDTVFESCQGGGVCGPAEHPGRAGASKTRWWGAGRAKTSGLWYWGQNHPRRGKNTIKQLGSRRGMTLGRVDAARQALVPPWLALATTPACLPACMPTLPAPLLAFLRACLPTYYLLASTLLHRFVVCKFSVLPARLTIPCSLLLPLSSLPLPFRLAPSLPRSAASLSSLPRHTT